MDVHAGGYARRGSGSASDPIVLDSDRGVVFRQDYSAWGPFEPSATLRAVYDDVGLFALSGWRTSLALVVGNRTVPSVSLDDTLEEAFGDAETVFMKWARSPQQATAVRGDP